MSDPGLLRPPASVLFGSGAGSQVPALAAQHGRKVLLCTDAFLASSEVGATLIASLRDAGLDVSVWDRTVAELPIDSVLEGIEFGGEADVVVGFGGGSCIDLAKLVALGIAEGITSAERLRDFFGEKKAARPILPLVAVPTTAGTGSEVTPVAVLTDPDRALKVGISGRHLTPTAAVVDPLLTHGCPPAVTAYAGIDALAHAVEAFTARPMGSPERATKGVFVGKNRLSDQFALEAMRQIAPNLLGAIADEQSAREALAWGSLSAGLAFATAGTAAAHALQYPIGARTKTPHGLGTGLLLSAVMDFNRTACGPALAEAARAMGFAGAGDDEERAIDRGVAGVRDLAQAAGLPSGLREIGVAADELPGIAEQASGIGRLVDNNPRPLDRDGLLEILAATWDPPAASFDETKAGA